MVLLEAITKDDMKNYEKIFSALVAHTSLYPNNTNIYKFNVDNEVKFVFQHGSYFFVYWLDDNEEEYYDSFIINEDGAIIYVDFGDFSVNLAGSVPIFYLSGLCHSVMMNENHLTYKQWTDDEAEAIAFTYDNKSILSFDFNSFDKRPSRIDVLENGQVFNYFSASSLKEHYGLVTPYISYSFSFKKAFDSIKKKGFLLNVPSCIISFFESDYFIVAEYQHMVNDIFAINEELKKVKK